MHVGMSIFLAQHIRDSSVMSYCETKERGGINIVGKEKDIHYIFFLAFSLIHVFAPANGNF